MPGIKLCASLCGKGYNPSTYEVYKIDSQLGRKRGTQLQKFRKTRIICMSPTKNK